jgi:hypothetical protein
MLIVLRFLLLILGLSTMPEPHGHEWFGWLAIGITVLL